jgi:starch synthase
MRLRGAQASPPAIQATPIKTVRTATPHLPSAKHASPIAPQPPIVESKQKLAQLRELKQLLDDPTKTQRDLIAKYEKLVPSLKATLSELVWICHYKPNELGFGDRILYNDMRTLSKIQNQDHVDCITQLISHYSNKVQASELAVEIHRFILAAGQIANDKKALLHLFNGLSDKAKNDLRYKVWYNHGGDKNPHFGTEDYGAKKITENVSVLWENFLGTSSSLPSAYLRELEKKENYSDKNLLENLSAVYNLDKVFNTSAALLENKQDLIASLPQHLRTAFVTAELSGVASIGGLASALDGLVRGLGEDDSRVIMPLYENGPIKDLIMNNLVETDYEINVHGKNLKILKPNKQTRENELKGVHVYFIADPTLFYVPKKGDGTAGNFYEGEYDQTRHRWAVFQKAAADLCYKFSKKRSPFELVHVHDAQAALVPKFLKEAHLEEWKRGETPATVFTYHNNQEAMEYQGEKNTALLASLGLPKQGMNSFIEGLHDAEIITTVSPQFAKESQWEHSDFGKGMHRAVRQVAKEGKLFGITNGNSNNWNPAKSKQLQEWVSVLPATLGTQPDLRFGPHMTDRQLADQMVAIQRELCAYLKGLGPNNPAYADLDPEKPIVFYVGRYDSSQKGVEKLQLIMEETLAKGGQFVCIGAEPDPTAKETLKEMKKSALQKKNKGVLILEDRKENGAFIYQGVFGDLLRAACTLAVFPSKFEPCGLVQGELLKYGKKVMATKTGGFIDTLQTEGPDANAYLFERKSHWGSKHHPSHEQNEAIKLTLHKALEEAKLQQSALYHGSDLAKSKYTSQMRKIMEDAIASTWETTPDNNSLSAIRLYELAYAEAFQRRKKRNEIPANLNILQV